LLRSLAVSIGLILTPPEAEIPGAVLIVDAKDAKAAAFYRHHGFIELGRDLLHLFLPLATAKWTVWYVVPECEQQRALEQKTIGVCRLTQTVEDTFQSEAHQHLVEIHALGLGEIEQACPDGSRDVLVHSMASR
jgi:hypothetical protein